MRRKVTSIVRHDDWTNIKTTRGRITSMTSTPRFVHTLECGHTAERKAERDHCICTECL